MKITVMNRIDENTLLHNDIQKREETLSPFEGVLKLILENW